MTKQVEEQIRHGILGDINPPVRPHASGSAGDEPEADDVNSMDDGSINNPPKHSGSREIAGGGAGTEVGGTRNFRQGTGFVGGDIGNRPE
jgi:hypothetical protein